MALSLSYAICLGEGPHDFDQIQVWVEGNIDDCLYDSGHFFFSNNGEDTFIHFISQNDAFTFEEEFEEMAELSDDDKAALDEAFNQMEF